MKITASLLLAVLLVSCGTPRQDSSPETTTEDPAAAQNDPQVEEPPIQNPANVLDYFALLQWKSLADDYYIFVERDGQYLCVENMGDEYDYSGSLDELRHYPATVDVKNGFLSIEDEGTGDGVFYKEVALFKRSDNSYMVALNGYGSTPPNFGQHSGIAPRFFLWQHNEFIEISKDVLPAVSTASNAIEFYKLPRIGRVITFTQTEIDSTSQPIERTTVIKLEFDSSTDKFVRKD